MALELNGICYSWPTGGGVHETDTVTHYVAPGAMLINALSLTLAEGERVALLGGNGAGKSTLMHIIMGLVTPQKGTIRVFGSPVSTEVDFASLRRRVGFLFQDSDDQLFCPTVEEDVAFGPLNLGLTHAEARERVAGTLDALGIGHLKRSVTHRLSGGEKRLVAFATIAAMRPDIYILDEPTSGLDRQRRETLTSYINDHVHTALITSHDADFLSGITDRSVSL